MGWSGWHEDLPIFMALRMFDIRKTPRNYLRLLRHGNNLLWMVGRDFNEILYSLEKNGGIPRE